MITPPPSGAPLLFLSRVGFSFSVLAATDFGSKYGELMLSKIPQKLGLKEEKLQICKFKAV